MSAMGRVGFGRCRVIGVEAATTMFLACTTCGGGVVLLVWDITEPWLARHIANREARRDLPTKSRAQDRCLDADPSHLPIKYRIATR